MIDFILKKYICTLSEYYIASSERSESSYSLTADLGLGYKKIKNTTVQYLASFIFEIYFLIGYARSFASDHHQEQQQKNADNFNKLRTVIQQKHPVSFAFKQLNNKNHMLLWSEVVINALGSHPSLTLTTTSKHPWLRLFHSIKMGDNSSDACGAVLQVLGCQTSQEDHEILCAVRNYIGEDPRAALLELKKNVRFKSEISRQVSTHSGLILHKIYSSDRDIQLILDAQITKALMRNLLQQAFITVLDCQHGQQRLQARLCKNLQQEIMLFLEPLVIPLLNRIRQHVLAMMQKRRQMMVENGFFEALKESMSDEICYSTSTIPKTISYSNIQNWQNLKPSKSKAQHASHEDLKSVLDHPLLHKYIISWKKNLLTQTITQLNKSGLANQSLETVVSSILQDGLWKESIIKKLKIIIQPSAQSNRTLTKIMTHIEREIKNDIYQKVSEAQSGFVFSPQASTSKNIIPSKPC